jgi:sialate O-acetylesterase
MSLGPAQQASDSLPLAGHWRVFAEHPIPLVPASVWSTYPQPSLLLAPHRIPASLHHGMIAPVAPYGIRGFLWYQGESDVNGHEQYTRRQVALVRDLRAHFACGTLPFLFVELAGYQGGPRWPFMREAQQQTTQELWVHMATARDIGDVRDIHPRNKREVGRRLALLARAYVYEQNIVARGPQLERVQFVNGAARVWFHFAEGLRSRDSEDIAGFELAGIDGTFRPARAEIREDYVHVTSREVECPVHVRYAFSDTGEGNLENSAGLPALSFRTDCAAVTG